MKNANIFIDVDLTLVDQNLRLIEGAREAMAKLCERGCHLYLWSTGGAEYCQKVARFHKLEPYIEGCCPKPDIIIDDMPSTVLNPFHFDINHDGGWAETVNKLLTRHVD